MSAPPARPLAGVGVLDLTRLLPGPFATLLLADLGADVVKVEDTAGGDWLRYLPPGGAVSGVFAALNRDKRSVSLDLKHPAGKAAFETLVRRADVVIESFRPGVMERLGLGHGALCALNPRLICCAITGYGQRGPLRHRAGHDLNYLATAGLASVGGRDGEVVQPGVQVADVAGGSLYAVIGVLAALLQRATTGAGQIVDASMTDGVAGLGIMLHAKQFLDGLAIRPGGDNLAGALPSYRTWRCKGGGHLAVAALEPKFWMGFCAAIGRGDLAGDGMAEGDRAAEVEAELAAVFATRTRDEWGALFATLDVCVEPVLELDEARRSEHARARGLFGEHDHPTGGRFLHQYPNPRLLPASPPPDEPRPAPLLGQHTVEVLAESGYEAEAIEALISQGAARA